MRPRFTLDRLSDAPIQEQLYQRIRTGIAEARLAPGERLPASRVLASELGIARGTVDAAYARLAGEGYVIARGPAGTNLTPTLRTDLRPPAGPPLPQGPLAETPRAAPLPFQLGLPALDMFPRTLWARLTARAARRLTGAALAYPDPLGLPALRDAIASYLAISRGVVCRPAQIVVTGGFQAALTLLAHCLLRPGDAVWFEEPGYFRAREALEAAGARLAAVPVDAAGLRVEHGRDRAPDARLAVVTPAHQSPLGNALSLPRRQALLAWAVAAEAWILEDDYDSEFHYVGRKLPALKSLDTADRVIYAGSFSKTLFPGLRLGYLVLPEALIEQVGAALRVARSGEPLLGQAVAAAFMAEGHFARHLKHMRGVYAARRTALAAAIRDAFGARAMLAPQAGGMHLLVRIQGGEEDTAIVRRAAAAGLAPTALSTQYSGPDRTQGLLLGFTNIAETQAAEAARRLLEAIG